MLGTSRRRAHPSAAAAIGRRRFSGRPAGGRDTIGAQAQRKHEGAKHPTCTLEMNAVGGPSTGGSIKKRVQRGCCCLLVLVVLVVAFILLWPAALLLMPPATPLH